MFTTLIVQPIFNLLVAIYALLPGHNFGLAIILFTIVIRLLMWPLVKKQLHQAKVMRKIQPELKRIKKAAKGDKRKEQLMMLELYKEKGVNPFSSLGVIILQIPIFIGLYMGLTRVVKDPHEIISFAYPFLQDLSWLKQLGENIHLFDATLFGAVDLTRAALGGGGVYWPAMIIVLGSVVAQYYQSKQLLPNDKDARSLRAIMKEAGTGKQADQSEVNAAISRNMRYLLPALIFVFTVNLPSALSLYWLVSGLVAFIQQSVVLREDTTEMEEQASKSAATTDTPAKKRAAKAVEAEVVSTTKKSTKKTSPKKKAARTKRRKK